MQPATALTRSTCDYEWVPDLGLGNSRYESPSLSYELSLYSTNGTVTLTRDSSVCVHDTIPVKQLDGQFRLRYGLGGFSHWTLLEWALRSLQARRAGGAWDGPGSKPYPTDFLTAAASPFIPTTAALRDWTPLHGNIHGRGDARRGGPHRRSGKTCTRTGGRH